MKLTSQNVVSMRWVARIIALFVLLFGLPFYFGYGNPLPFLNPAYTFWDNMWLTIFPFVFIGLLVGWKCEKTGGYLVTIPLVLGLLYALIIEREFLWFMFVPLISGVLYLILGYKK